jgi:hypothetical protein
MQIQKYIKTEYPSKISQMEFSLSISELKSDFQSEIILRDEIMKIAAKWLSLNIKSRVINNENGLIVLVDYILDDCSNLELQEIDFVFRNGVLGKLGVIFNDISIDTVVGWFEKYYSEFRILRTEPIKKDTSIVLSGKEISHSDWMRKYGDYKLRAAKHELSFEELYYHMDESVFLTCGCNAMKEYLEAKKEYEPIKESEGFRLKKQRLEKILQFSEVEYLRRCLNDRVAVKSVSSVFSEIEISNFILSKR